MNQNKQSEETGIEKIRRHYPSDIIHFGIAMAGAVSAGAYSAGVMHYLLTSLETWEKLKLQNFLQLERLIPNWKDLENEQLVEAIINAESILRAQQAWVEVDMHDIRIEIIAGASAGSLVAAIATLSLGYVQEPLTFDSMIHEDPNHIGKVSEIRKSFKKEEGLRNLLFDSWVNLNDGGNIEDSVFIKLLNVDAETELRLPFSLLNGTVLDKVRDHQLHKVFESGTKYYEPRAIPAYVSPDFRVLYSLTLLQGIPLSVHFQQTDGHKNDPHPAHRMRRHSYMARFAIQPKENEESELDLCNPKKSLEMINAALASGAFPVGLPPRKLLIPPAQLQSFLKIPGLKEKSRIRSEVSDTYPPEQYIVDGGVLNNEPIMEVFDHLKGIEGKKGELPKRRVKALLLIDPFPNYEVEPDVALDGPDTLQKVAAGLLGALRGQGMMKDISALDSSKQTNLVLGMISPSRRDKDGTRVKPAIATSAMEGFAGFIERDFRLHDFYLGMKNAQSFFNVYFGVESVEEDNKIKTLSIHKKYSVLPDLKVLEGLTNANQQEKTQDQVSFATKFMRPPSAEPEVESIPSQAGERSDKPPAHRYGNIEYPRYKQKKLLKLRPFLVRRILFLIRHRLFSTRTSKPRSTWRMKRLIWSNRIWYGSVFLAVAGLLIGLFFVIGAQYFWILFLSILLIAGWTFFAVVQRLANMCIQRIGQELHKHNLLD